MNIGEMVIVALAVAQALKEFLRSWIKIEGKASIILVIAVCAGVVGYKFITESMPFDLAAFILLVSQVASLAVGGKMSVASIAKKVSL